VNDVVAGHFPFVVVARDRSPSPAGGSAAKNLLAQYRPAIRNATGPSPGACSRHLTLKPCPTLTRRSRPVRRPPDVRSTST